LRLPNDIVRHLPEDKNEFVVQGAGGAETLLIFASRKHASPADLHEVLTQAWKPEDGPIGAAVIRQAVRTTLWPRARKPVFLAFGLQARRSTKLDAIRQELQKGLAQKLCVERAIMLSLPSIGQDE